MDTGRIQAVIGAKRGVSDWYFRRLWRSAQAHPWSRQWVRDLADASASQIHAIGVGEKWTGGKPTGVLSIRFYVHRKMPRSRVGLLSRVPAQIEGLETDVIEARPARLADNSCSLKKRSVQRPIRGGISVAAGSITAGTIAAICTSTRPGEAGRRYVLSNNHVLADSNAAPLDTPILQPAMRDGGVAADRVGRLARFAPIELGATSANQVDAAVAELDAGIATDPEICRVGTVTGVKEPAPLLTVCKHGRTSGYTEGVIDDPSFDVITPVGSTGAVARFVDQIRIVAAPGYALFGQAGDSGALIVEPGTRAAIGLLYAVPADASYACANPIRKVLEQLEIAFV